MYTYLYPRPMVTVDSCIFFRNAEKSEILLIQRKNDPFKNTWALPGGFVEMEEDLLQAAIRETLEETGVEITNLQQFKAYGTPGRDPRGRTITIVFTCILAKKPVLIAGSDAKEARWFYIDTLPETAFDHMKIIREASEMVL